METTLLLIKPDATGRQIVWRVLSYFETEPGLEIINIRSTLYPAVSLCHEHYIDHVFKPYFQRNVEFLHSGLVIAVLIRGDNAVCRVRDIVGATDPAKAGPSTLRGGWLTWVNHRRMKLPYNLVHASDSLDAADRESLLWFP